jgi:hypothetical protein
MILPGPEQMKPNSVQAISLGPNSNLDEKPAPVATQAGSNLLRGAKHGHRLEQK